MTQIYQYKMQKSGWNLSWHIPQINRYVKTRPVVVHQIDEQCQIDLVHMSKLSNHNDGFKFIIMVTDVLSKYAWLKSLNSN